VIQTPLAPLVQLPTGVPGLDEVLGGGIPEYSFSLIAGGPGSGKTTLAHQVMFANTSSGRPGVYFSGAGQPTRKLLAQQQQFGFFDADRVNRGIHYVNLAAAMDADDPSLVVDVIQREVEDRRASIVVVDLVRGLTYPDLWTQLATCLARCEATAFLLGDYERVETAADAAMSTADAVLFLRQTAHGEATGRTIELVKIRGQQPQPGQHNLRVTRDGIEVFPRWPTPKVRRPWAPVARLRTGVEAIDDLLGGGVPSGDALLVEGPSGTGKSVFATHFIAEGARCGQPGIVFLFEERPDRFVERAGAFNQPLARLMQAGLVEVLSFRGRDISADEVIAEVQLAVTRVGARRVVIDSAGSLDLALTGGRGLHDCLWRLLDALTGAGVTVWLNSALDVGGGSLAGLVDDVLALRRIEQDTWLENRLGVSKMRWSAHSSRLVSYAIDAGGVQVTEARAKPAPTGCLFDVPIIGATQVGNGATVHVANGAAAHLANGGAGLSANGGLAAAS
jgi:circadian clock protein KaiC